MKLFFYVSILLSASLIIFSIWLPTYILSLNSNSGGRNSWNDGGMQLAFSIAVTGVGVFIAILIGLISSWIAYRAGVGLISKIIFYSYLTTSVIIIIGIVVILTLLYFDKLIF